MASLEMVQDCVGCYWQEGLVGAPAALYPGFFAHPAHPFIGAGRRVAFLAGLLVLPQLGIHILSASEEPEKESDFVLRS